MVEDASRSLVETARAALKHADLGEMLLVASTPRSALFGNSTAVFKIGPLLLRFNLDRGQQFIDIASEAEPTKFHQFDDVEIAMGWTSIEKVLDKREQDPIELVLQRLRTNLNVLTNALSGETRLTRARIEKAARERGQAFVARLRGKP
jgi:hypothetical protein